MQLLARGLICPLSKVFLSEAFALVALQMLITKCDYEGWIFFMWQDSGALRYEWNTCHSYLKSSEWIRSSSPPDSSKKKTQQLISSLQRIKNVCSNICYLKGCILSRVCVYTVQGVSKMDALVVCGVIVLALALS